MSTGLRHLKPKHVSLIYVISVKINAHYAVLNYLKFISMIVRMYFRWLGKISDQHIHAIQLHFEILDLIGTRRLILNWSITRSVVWKIVLKNLLPRLNMLTKLSKFS